MLDTLQKMSGTTHRVFSDQESITTDVGRWFFRKDDKRTTTNSVKEVPVISYNDMAFIPMCNSIVFRAGDSPIWNRNQTCLPMSWRLFDNTITKPGKKYSLQTIPTLSSAMDFDVRQNQPNFIKMWERRRDQAVLVDKVKKAYATAYRYTLPDGTIDDDAIARLDQDTYADEIMEVVNAEIAKKEKAKADADRAAKAAEDVNKEEYTENEEFTESAAKSAELDATWGEPRYAGGLLSKKSLQPFPDVPSFDHGLDEYIVSAFMSEKAAFAHDTEHFHYRSDGSLYSADGKPYLLRTVTPEDVERMQEAAKEKDTRVYRDEAMKMSSEYQGLEVEDAFYQFLVSQSDWKRFASGKFEIAMARAIGVKPGDK